MLLLLSCHNVQEYPLWSHNMPHLLTGTTHFTNSLKDINSSTYTPVQPHSGIARYDTNLALCNVMMSSDMIHITAQYMIILPLSSQTRPYANACKHYVHLLSCSNNTHSLCVPPTHFSSSQHRK